MVKKNRPRINRNSMFLLKYKVNKENKEIEPGYILGSKYLKYHKINFEKQFTFSNGMLLI